MSSDEQDVTEAEGSSWRQPQGQSTQPLAEEATLALLPDRCFSCHVIVRDRLHYSLVSIFSLQN